MINTGKRKTIINTTDPGKKHEIRFMAMPEGGSPGKMKRLPGGEKSVLDEGELLVIASDYRTNYQIRCRNGARLELHQVNNHHPDYPGQTVAVYKMVDDDAASTGDTGNDDSTAGDSTDDDSTAGDSGNSNDTDSDAADSDAGELAVSGDDTEFSLSSTEGDYEVFDPQKPDP